MAVTIFAKVFMWSDLKPKDSVKLPSPFGLDNMNAKPSKAMMAGPINIGLPHPKSQS
jgi:hypothetical protein